MAAALGPAAASAAEPTASEKANMNVVTDFCAAFSVGDVDKIMAFFADPCSYRAIETMDPTKGFAAVKGAHRWPCAERRPLRRARHVRARSNGVQ